jgi:hypothetical protein
MDIQNQEKGRKRVLSVMSSSEMERIEGLNLEEEPSPTLEDEVLEEDSFDDSVSPLDPATSVEI